MGFAKKILDSSVWVAFIASVVFSLVTTVARNAYPGDSLYGFKLGYEKVMLASSKFFNRQVDLQIKFVARRFEETSRVLASKQGSESLKRLNGEVESTAYTITLIEDPGEQKVAAQKYLTQLNYVSSGLQQQRNTVTTQSSSIAPATDNYPTNPPVAGYENTAPAPTKIPTSPTSQIVTDIDQTQLTIDETIEEMESIIKSSGNVLPSPSRMPTPTQTPVPTATPVPAENIIAPIDEPTPFLKNYDKPKGKDKKDKNDYDDGSPDE